MFCITCWLQYWCGWSATCWFVPLWHDSEALVAFSVQLTVLTVLQVM